MRTTIFNFITFSFAMYAATLNAIPNPASQFCADSGGTLRIETRGDGGQYGVCDFGQNNLCEEWALMKGNCPPQGIGITSDMSKPAVYCLIGGGSLSGDQGECLLPTGSICKLEALWMCQCDNLGIIKEPALEDLTN